MLRDDVILRAKLVPPVLPRRVLPRPALIAKLQHALDYRLTLVQAGTGYGKSTALAALADSDLPVGIAWYSIDELDTDPGRFLSYLIASFRSVFPHLSDAPQAQLHEVSQAGGGSWTLVVDVLINALIDVIREPIVLVLDDYHFVAGSADITALLDRFISYLPLDLHVILALRQPMTSPGLVVWRAKGQVWEIGRDQLAFQPAEIEMLFRETYGLYISPADVATLADRTEGWPIALQLVWQGLRQYYDARDTPLPSAADLLVHTPSSLSALFDYLAHEVLGRQPSDIAAFLRDTAVLRELIPAACNAVTGTSNAASVLAQLHDLGLFVVALGERHYRYHHLFHDFLRAQLAADPDAARERHRRAAAYFSAEDDPEVAIYHWLVAGEYDHAAHGIEHAGEPALRAGRLDTVAMWIDSLPAEILAHHPILQRYLGDVYRLRSQFAEALAWYEEAERAWRAKGDLAGVGRALRGQALVYLDTVRPAQAEHLLEEALRITDGLADRQAHARLLELLAENKLNMGKPNEAEALHAAARSLREEGPSEDVLGVRVKLRTGRLEEAQRILEAWRVSEQSEGEHAHPPRMHRETVLLLSLLHSFRGQPDRAFELAQEGVALGERLNSPFITTVAHLRLGHAWQLLPRRNEDNHRDAAIRCYQTGIAMGDQIAVRRVRAEAMWGLVRAYGFLGDLQSAERAAAEGIDIGRWAGDPWIVALIELALGSSLVLAEQWRDALDVLSRVLASFRDCGDSFGRAASRLWLSLTYLQLRQMGRFATCVEDALALCETHGYDFLFLTPTLLGPPDPRCWVPLLIAARDRGHRRAYAVRMLAQIGLPGIVVHPGYQLRVQTLGAFRAWRGQVEIEPRAWQRDKARQLFQLLLTHRDVWLHRDEIVDRLWPNLSPEAAGRDFKVALNALNRAIEPNRSADDPFAFIVRDGTAYQLRPDADLWLDAADFQRECEAGLRLSDSDAPVIDEAILHLQAGLQAYGGDYLPDALYEDWSSDERERLLSLYLRAADKLASLLFDRERYNEVLDVCQLILARDACWERAYRLMMLAHDRQGNRPLALRTYQRCANSLRHELGVEPSPATTHLYRSIAQAGEEPVTGV